MATITSEAHCCTEGNSSNVTASHDIMSSVTRILSSSREVNTTTSQGHTTVKTTQSATKTSPSHVVLSKSGTPIMRLVEQQQRIPIIRPGGGAGGSGMSSKNCEDQVELRRLRTENRLLKQRVENLEKETTTMGTRLIQKEAKIARQEEELNTLKNTTSLGHEGTAPSSLGHVGTALTEESRTTNKLTNIPDSTTEQVSDHPSDDSSDVINAISQNSRDDTIGRLRWRINELNEREADACDTIRQLNDKIAELEQANERLSEPQSVELLSIQDELVACKLREAESNLSMKELQQSVQKLERHWQQFLQENQKEGLTSGTQQQQQQQQQQRELEARELVMALRLRETRLVSDLNELKMKLMERETQTHIYERQIKRQDAELEELREKLFTANATENELLNSNKEFQRKIGNLETKCKEEDVMCKIRGAEYSQTVAEMRRRIAELEIENQERLTSAELHDKDAYIRELENRILELIDELKTVKRRGMSTSSGMINPLHDIDNMDMSDDMSDDMTASFYNDLHLMSNMTPQDYITAATKQQQQQQQQQRGSISNV